MRLPVALVQLDATATSAPTSIARRLSPTRPRPEVHGSSPCPEYLQYRGDDDGFRASARPIPGPFTDAFAEVARRHDAWILAGSLAETIDDRRRGRTTRAS